MTPHQPRQPLLPVGGYVLLNLIVIGLFVAIYFAAHWYAEQNNFRLAGIFPVLLICYIAFFLISIYDAAFDRMSSRQRADRNAEDDED